MSEREDRERMVERQIAARGVRDTRVLEAFREIPRHLFVPPPYRHAAYEDRPLTIGEGQTISQPFMVALMTELLGVEPHHRVLEIGTGSGYQAAILGRLAGTVVSVERHVSLAESARALLASLEITNVEILIGDGTEGAPAQAPFDRIIVTAGSPAVPPPLEAQLADGGRLVIPVGPPSLQRLRIVHRTGGEFWSREGDACVFVPLTGRHGWPATS